MSSQLNKSKTVSRVTRETAHFLSITDLNAKEIWQILELALKLKTELKCRGGNKAFLKNKTLLMIFEKPSLRTRVSFEIGMTQFGGHAIYLAPSDIGLGVREEIKDVARVLARMGDVIMARVFKHKTVSELAKYSSIPVINGLSDLEHPCQILADLFTIYEIKKKLTGLKLAFIGDGDNNVTHSLALASGLLGVDFSCASPKGFWMNKEVSKKAQKLAKVSGGVVFETENPQLAVKNADIIYTDTWVSMGDEKDKARRMQIFRPYQVTGKLMQLAKKDALFMHDLPAYKGNEVGEEVFESKQSVVFPQAENRLHVQKALMLFLLGE